MARPIGRPVGNARQRAMRFALWARQLSVAPTNAEIAAVLGISLTEAREWRADWLDAISPTNPLPGEQHARCD